MTMEDWAKHLDGILTSTGENLLAGNGSIGHLQAMEKAQTEYRKYKAKTLSNVEQDYLDSIKMLEQKGKKKQYFSCSGIPNNCMVENDKFEVVFGRLFI